MENNRTAKVAILFLIVLQCIQGVEATIDPGIYRDSIDGFVSLFNKGDFEKALSLFHKGSIIDRETEIKRLEEILNSFGTIKAKGLMKKATSPQVHVGLDFGSSYKGYKIKFGVKIEFKDGTWGILEAEFPLLKGCKEFNSIFLGVPDSDKRNAEKFLKIGFQYPKMESEDKGAG